MSFIDFITFIAAMLFLFLSMRRSRRQESPEEVEAEEQEQAERLKEFLQAVHKDMQEIPKVAKPPIETKKTPAPQNLPKQKPVKHVAKEVRVIEPPLSLVEDAYTIEHKLAFHQAEKDAYAVIKRRKSRADSLVRSFKNKQDMILLHEIIGPPKAIKRERSYGEFPH